MWSSLSAASHRHLLTRSSTPLLRAAVAPPPLASAPACGDTHSRPSSLHALTLSRGFYWPRNNWFPWRQRLVHQRQAALRKKRHIWPRKYDQNEAPIFGGTEDGEVLAFREKEVRLGLKRMLEYAKIIRGKQIQDALDWVNTMNRMKSEPVLKLLRKALQECIEKHSWDPARIYVFDAQPQRGYTVKSIRMHSRAHFGVNKSPRHMFMVRVREMPLEEYFHRIYIFGKVPRSLACDMRMALHEGQVNPQTAKEWAPYLCANSRIRHRRELKWLDCNRQFDYYKARHEWIQRYKANLLRGSTEAREARGLPPLVAE